MSTCLKVLQAITHARELYRAVPEWCLQWPARAPKLVKEILHWSADIICLQVGSHLNALYPNPCLQSERPRQAETHPCP